MNWFGLFIVTFGLFYLISSFVFRKDTTIYFKNMVIVESEKDEYLQLQLYFSIVVSIILIIVGIAITVLNLDVVYIIFSPMIVSFFNYVQRKVSTSKGYIIHKYLGF